MKFIKILIVMMLVVMPVFSQTGMPSITVTESEKEFTLPIKRAKVDVKIVGSLAITTYDIHFFNPNKRTLEGQLDFPLADGVVVSRFAMDVNEKLREGVIVEKDKGRQTFEKIVKRRVDPGLLEVTRGSNFRSRVYPLWPEHEKHIVIAYEEELKVTPDGLKYSLPLDMPNKLDELSFKATIYSDFAKPINNSTNGSKFRHKDDSYTLMSEYTDYKAKELYEFIIPYFGEESVQLETYNNEDFFRISLNPDMTLQAKEKPQTISILWDISASRLNSDIDKDLDLLEEYLAYNKCNVELVPFSVYTDEPSYFQNVDFDELKANINGLRIDGATNYSSVDISKLRGDEIFIFSDGIDNIGEGGFGETDKPMYIINSSSISDHDVCRKLAQKTGGKYINLVDENTESALNLLTYNFPYFMGIEGAASQVYPKNEVVKGNINISGKLQSSSQIKLKFGYGNKVAKTITVNITEANRTNSGILHKIWAKQKLADLNLNQTQNETEITELGKKYSLVTAFTSLIVLETARDYYRYKIEPPAELREEYDSVKSKYDKYYARRNKDRVADSLENLKYLKEEIQNQVNRLKLWYGLDFKEVQYLDSCYKIIDKKVGELIAQVDITNDTKPYYVINLKEILPKFDFSKHRHINYCVIGGKKGEYYSFDKMIEYDSVMYNDKSTSFRRSPYYYGLYYFSHIYIKNFMAEKVSDSTLENLSFNATSKYSMENGIDPKYNNNNVSMDSNFNLSVNISPKDLDSFYSKLYLIKDSYRYLHKDDFKKIDRWNDYSDLLGDKIRNIIDNIDKTPEDELITTLDLDELLPEFQDLNKEYFKCLDLSWHCIVHNNLDDSLYESHSSSYQYFYDLSQKGIDSSKLLKDYVDYFSSKREKKLYWEYILNSNANLQYVHKSRLNLNGLYLVTDMSYLEYKNRIRSKFKDIIYDVHGRIAVQIAKDSQSLDLSKVYILKNIAMIFDDQDYYSNIVTQSLMRNYDYRKRSSDELFDVVPVSDILDKYSNKEKCIRIGINQGRYYYDYDIFTIDSIILNGQNKKITADIKTTSPNHYPCTTEEIYSNISLQDLKNQGVSQVDSITIKFSMRDSSIVFSEAEAGLLTFDKETRHFIYSIKMDQLKDYTDNFIMLNQPKVEYENNLEKKTTKYIVNNLYAEFDLAYPIKGKVTDENGKPLPGATVRILGTRKGAKTKPNGSFLINYVPSSVFDIKTTFIGKEPKIIECVRSHDSIVNLHIQLKDQVRNHANVVITSAQATREDEENEGLSLSESGNSGFELVESKNTSNSKVNLTSYQSSKEYYKTLSSVALGELEDTYFELRKDNAMNPSFFFDAAQVFETQGKIKEACRVMSNLAEINLEDHENLRRVGGFLMEHKEYSLAKSIYKHILKIRSEEPQSFRDYALCLAESGEFQAAADSLYNLFNSPITWDCKGIRTALITEFNTLLVEHKDEIDISNYDSDYIFETPVDLKIELSWVMDGIDIDLWVQEPDRTNCHKGYRFTKNGGYFSANWYRDNNPSVYMIKNAIPGTYKIKAQYKSNRRQKSSLEPQVRCKIYTNYGRSEQKLQENVIKIEIDKGEVDLGEIVIE